MNDISSSFDKITNFIQKSEIKEASKEYKKIFAPTVKNLYLEAERNNPFEILDNKDWASWAETLNEYSQRGMTAFRQDKKDRVEANLNKIRDHFYKLRVNTYSQQSNDYIYALYDILNEEMPKAQDITEINELLKKSILSAKADKNRTEYEKVKNNWLKISDEVVKDCDLDEKELKSLREEIQKFYLQYGVQFY